MSRFFHRSVGFFCTLVAFIFPLLAGGGCVHDEEPDHWSLRTGDRIPAFSLLTLEGRMVDSEGFSGAILFFSVTCGDCRRELPKLEQQYRELRQDGKEDFKVVCISRDDDAGAVTKFCDEFGITMPVVAIGGSELYHRFASSGVPRLYIVTDGVIEAVYLESFPDDCLLKHYFL